MLTPIDIRLRLAALWTATMFIVAYVDIFAFYRADVRADLDAGKVSAGFEIGQGFLLFTTLYVVIPSLMIPATVFLGHRANRIANIVVPAVYIVTIVGAAIGEWAYYLVASGIEVVLLAAVIRLAWAWRVESPPSHAVGPAAHQGVSMS